MTRAIAQKVAADNATDDLFARIGEFLRQQHLSAAPQHYAFAYRVLTEVDSPLARIVAELTYGGIRLSRKDIEALGGTVATAGEHTASLPTIDKAEGLVAQTQTQVESFTDLMRAMRIETQDFGSDLVASADAMRDSGRLEADQMLRLTGTMLARVRHAESRLEAATREANELRSKLEEARDNARRDPLTDLPNRRAFEEAYADRIARGERLCLAVCDVDHFKTVNDRFGHSVGDRVLKAIADSLAQSCPGHFVARHGGEEFAILFVDVSADLALLTLNDARKAVAGRHYRLRDTDVQLGAITFSAGLTVAMAGEPLPAAFGRADRLLYLAKDGGRNLVKVG